MGSVNGARSPHLAISVQAWGEAGATLAIAGDLDMAGLAALRHALRHALREGHRHLVFDLSDTTFLDCAALEEVLQVVRPLQDDASAAVVFAAAGGTVRRLLQILHFEAVIGTVESPERAIEACRRDPSGLPDGWRRVQPGSH